MAKINIDDSILDEVKMVIVDVSHLHEEIFPTYKFIYDEDECIVINKLINAFPSGSEGKEKFKKNFIEYIDYIYPTNNIFKKIYKKIKLFINKKFKIKKKNNYIDHPFIKYKNEILYKNGIPIKEYNMRYINNIKK